MTRLLRRRYVCLAVLLAILCASLAAALVRSSGSSASAVERSEPDATPGQVRLVSTWLDHLPVPAYWRRDITDTACPLGLLCVTASAAPRELISALRDVLAAHGGQMDNTDCVSAPARQHDGALSEEPICEVFGSYRGVAVSVLSGQRNAYQPPSSWVAAGARYTSGALPKAEPLPPVASLGAIPHQWPLSMRCTSRITAGCTRYISHLALRGSACDQIALLIDTLKRKNYDIQLQFRGPAVAGARCSIAADRKLKPGGGGWFGVGAALEDSGNNKSTGELFITAM